VEDVEQEAHVLALPDDQQLEIVRCRLGPNRRLLGGESAAGRPRVCGSSVRSGMNSASSSRRVERGTSVTLATGICPISPRNQGVTPFVTATDPEEVLAVVEATPIRAAE
jgi:hypothetical protein